MPDAVAELDEIRRTARLVNWPFFERLAHSHLARVHRDAGHLATALAHHEQALAIARAARDEVVERQESLNRAATLFELGEVDQAMLAVAENLDQGAVWVTSGTGAFAHTRIQAEVGMRLNAWVRRQLPLLAAAPPEHRAEVARGLAREVRALSALAEDRPRNAARLWRAAADALEPHHPDRAAAWRTLADTLPTRDLDVRVLLEHPLLGPLIRIR